MVNWFVGINEAFYDATEEEKQEHKEIFIKRAKKEIEAMKQILKYYEEKEEEKKSAEEVWKRIAEIGAKKKTED